MTLETVYWRKHERKALVAKRNTRKNPYTEPTMSPEDFESIDTTPKDENLFGGQNEDREPEPWPEPWPESKEYGSFKELGLDKPSPFTGDWMKVETFIQECRVYLQINKHIYMTDDAEVAFFLLLMKDKEALRWK